MFPLGDDNSTRQSLPLIVFLLIALNGFVWFQQISLGDKFTLAYSAVPYEITHGVDLASTVEITDLEGNTISVNHVPGPSLPWITLFTSMFMHGSWMHIIGNMLYLWIFGDQIEDRMGKFRFTAFYLLCGLGAGIAQILVDPNSKIPCLGASGAIAGVLGSYLLLYPSNRVRVLVGRQIVWMPASIVLGGWILMQFLSQVSVGASTGGGVAYMAHIGGFITGALLTFPFARRQ